METLSLNPVYDEEEREKTDNERTQEDRFLEFLMQVTSGEVPQDPENFSPYEETSETVHTNN